MDVASLMAAHWISTDLPAAFNARSRSLENVAMPHWRGGLVATNAIDRLLSSARLGWRSGMCFRWRRLCTEPVQDLSDLSGHESHAGVGGAVVEAQRTGSVEY